MPQRCDDGGKCLKDGTIQTLPMIILCFITFNTGYLRLSMIPKLNSPKYAPKLMMCNCLFMHIDYTKMRYKKIYKSINKCTARKREIDINDNYVWIKCWRDFHNFKKLQPCRRFQNGGKCHSNFLECKCKVITWSVGLSKTSCAFEGSELTTTNTLWENINVY